MEAHCSQCGVPSVSGHFTGARLVSMETGEQISLQQVENAITNGNDSIVVKDVATGLLKPGTSTRMSIASGGTREIPPNHIINPTTGNVVPIQGNVSFDPVSLKIIFTCDSSTTEHQSVRKESLIPFIPYPLNMETGEPVDTELQMLEHTSQLKLNGSMKDPVTGLFVPICAVTIHPRTLALLPIGGTHRDPVTNILVPIEVGSVMTDKVSGMPVPILGAIVDPCSGKVVPVGGSVEVQDGPSVGRKTLLVGDKYTEPLSQLPVRVSSANVVLEQGEVVPVSGDNQTYLDCLELSRQKQIVESLVLLCDLTQITSGNSNDELESSLPSKFQEVDLLYKALIQSRANNLGHSLRTLHSLVLKRSICDKLAETGGSPCYMEFKLTGQPLPVLMGFPVSDEAEGIQVPVLGYELNPTTSLGEPLAGTMDSINGGEKVPITVGEKAYDEAAGGPVPVVGAQRNFENGVVVPVTQDPGSFSSSKKRQVDKAIVRSKNHCLWKFILDVTTKL